jgi:copper chaperone NosL
MSARRYWRGVLRLALLCGLGCAGCSGGPVQPAALDTVNDQCASCRMIVSDARFAAQVAAPGEEPRFFDDLRCLREGLRSGSPLPEGAVVFVTDARTGAWVRASSAVYAILPGVATPMASHWVAWADEGSRRADPGGRDGTPIPAEEILGRTTGGGVGP